jgi:hypothetical protein
MKRSLFVAMAVLAVASACDKDPASKIKIAARPVQNINPSSHIVAPFKPEMCALQAEDSTGSSTFKATGPCSFHHEGNLKCRRTVDDFYVAILRKGPGVTTMAVYINVEAYKGPGPYDNAEVFLTVQDGLSYYHWSSSSVHVDVGPEEKYVDIPETSLAAEPPNTGTEVLSGRLSCAVVATSTTHAIPK